MRDEVHFSGLERTKTKEGMEFAMRRTVFDLRSRSVDSVQTFSSSKHRTSEEKPFFEIEV